MSEPTDQQPDQQQELPAARPNAALTADVVALLRRGGEDVAPGPEVVLAAGDGVVVRGDSEAVSRAEERLL